MCVRPWIVRMGWLVLPLLLVTGCSEGNSGDDDDASQGDDDSSGTVLEPSLEITGALVSTTEPGIYTITYVLSGTSGASFDLTATWSRDGVTYAAITPTSDTDLEGLEASPEGITHTIRWDTLADLGYRHEEVTFRLSGDGGGANILPTSFDMDVNNVQYDRPCVIQVDSPSQQDGQIPITYTLVDPAGDHCDVTIKVKSLGGGTINAKASEGYPSDPLTYVEVPPEGVTRTFVWDSEHDVGPFDESVNLVFAATDANQTNDDILPIVVMNDPFPAPGDVVLTELLPWPAAAPPFVELYNATHHSIDLSGVQLSSLSDSVILSPSESLWIAPESYLVLAQALDAYNTLWVDGVIDFIMNRSSDQILLWTGDTTDKTIVDSITYTKDFFGESSTVLGRSVSLMSEYVNTTDNDTQGNWCLESTPLAGYPDDAEDFGSPGAPALCSTF